MKVLLITSEELHPKNLFSSCFELAQANALKSIGIDVSIISVRLRPPFIFYLKRSILFLLQFKFIRIFQQIKLLIRSLLNHGKTNVYRYFIEGVEVFEALSTIKKAKANYEEMIPDWIKAGVFAYNEFHRYNKHVDLIHAHSRFFYAAALAEEIHSKYKIPFIITEHSSFYRRGTISEEVLAWMRLIIQKSNALLSVSSALGKTLIEKLQLNKEPIVIPNILDNIYLDVKINEGKIVGDEFSFIHVASLDDNKNQSMLIEAFAKSFSTIDNVKLKIVGDGDMKNELHQLVKKLNLNEKVIFLGKLPKSEVLKELLKSHCFVLSSKVETFGVVLIEAMAAGLPVISTRCGGAEDIVKENNGILVENNNVDAFSKALRNLFENYTSYNRSEIREQCVNTFSPLVVGEQLKNIYLNCIK